VCRVLLNRLVVFFVFADVKYFSEVVI